MELLVKPEMLTSYIYGPTFGNAEIVSFFMATPCFNNAEPFYYQLMHIMLKNTELLKHYKIR